MKNYYKILQVNENASDEIIKVAYKSLVKKYHPDLNKSKDTKLAEKQIKEINEAYNVLSDPILKMEYDRKLSGEDSNYTKQTANNHAETQNDSFFKSLWNSLDNDIKKAFIFLLVLFVLFIFLKIPFIKNSLSSLIKALIVNNVFLVILIIVLIVFFIYFRKKK